jgi:S-(hydroxymethyl)glutathione dehydrogenase/alcohol dehydrogenase
MTIARSAVVHGAGQPLEIQEVEWDTPRDDEIGVKILSCGVCHSDAHVIHGELPFPVPYPVVPGHEGGGVVEKVGKNVTRVKEGDKIVMSWIPSCGHCPPCIEGKGHLCIRGANMMMGNRDDGTCRLHTKDGKDIAQMGYLGAFSEYVVIPEDSAIPVDPDMDLNKIPVVGCRVPTGWGAVVNTAGAKQGCTALVVGLGGVGFSVIQGLKSVGAVVIIAADIVDKKDLAMEWGATHYIDASKQNIVDEVMKITGIGVNYAFDAIGNEKVQEDTVNATCVGGKAVWAGLAHGDLTGSINMSTSMVSLFNKMMTGTCYGGASPFEMVPQILNMYKAGKIKLDEYVSKEYKLEEINEAFNDMYAGKNICGVIRFD